MATGDWIRGKPSERSSERESGSHTGRCRHRATAHHKQHMLTRRRLPQPIHGRFAASWVVHPSAASGHHDAPTPAVRPWSSRQGSSIVHRDRSCRLSTAAVAASSPRQMAGCGSMLLDIARRDGGVRWVSGTSKRFAKVKVAHGARRETPAIPSFIEIRYRTVTARLSRQLLLLLLSRNITGCYRLQLSCPLPLLSQHLVCVGAVSLTYDFTYTVARVRIIASRPFGCFPAASRHHLPQYTA